MATLEERISGTIQAYDAQGWHRTGTEVDGASALWLAALAGESAETSLERFRFRQIEPRSAFVEAGGRRFDGLPLFDALPLEGGQLEGSLGVLASTADVGLAILDGPAAGEGFEAARREGGHRAIVAVTVGRQPGLVARNATDFKHPFGPPVLQVGSEAAGPLREMAQTQARVRLTIDTVYREAESANVMAKVRGSEATKAPVVVTTPRTGWWHCAGERGGGLAGWLEVLRAAAARPAARDVIFVAFAGHELGHLGLDAFLERHGGLVNAARMWVHFGANVGAARGRATRVSASTVADLEQARQALLAAGVEDVTTAPAGTVLGLESQRVNELGGKCISLLGGNDLFHLEADRWPGALDVGAVAKQARAFTSLVLRLADE